MTTNEMAFRMPFSSNEYHPLGGVLTLQIVEKIHIFVFAHAMSSSLPLLQANLRPDILYYCTFNPPTIPKIQGPENLSPILSAYQRLEIRALLSRKTAENPCSDLV